MGRIVFVQEKDLEWQWSRKANWPGAATEGEPRVRYKVLNTQETGGPNSQLAEYEPGHVEAPHSHPHDELLYILSGHGSLAERRLEPGVLLFIERDTVYGPLTAGEQGLTFLRVQMSAG